MDSSRQSNVRMAHTGFVGTFAAKGHVSLFRRSSSLSPCAIQPFPSTRSVRNARFHMSAEPSDDVESKPTPRFQKDMSPATKELRSVLKKCSIYLVGPMGCGKSVLGKYLALELGFRFLDIDDLIVAVAQKSIPEIFDQDGEDAFRDTESAVLDQVQPFIGCCIATGGGAVLRKANWGKLQSGIVIYLEASVDVLVDRLRGDSNRPLLANSEDLTERVSSILEERRSLYEQADVTVNVDKFSAVDDLGKEVIRSLTNFIKENPPTLSKLYPGNIPKGTK